MNARALALALLAALGAGFLAGRWSMPRGKAQTITVSPAKPLPERDISPAGQVRTVIVTRTEPGKPTPPPVPVPADFGQHLQTTDTTLPAGIFHGAIFGKLDGQRLTLRTVEWMDTPQGPAPIGEARTITAPVTFTLPAPPALPRWGAMPLLGLQEGRKVYGAAVSYARGPAVLQVGHVGNVSFIGAGARW